MNNPQDTSMGTISLIMGILGCVQILPCIGPIIAIITGYMAKGTAGESSGRTGRILGWLAVCIVPLLGIIIYVILALTVLGGFWWQTMLP
ncbi:MAG: hypothetical protein FK734_07200 [Asgard group archaeon]|nr:hypothetical protein [Asgard group archaeon]